VIADNDVVIVDPATNKVERTIHVGSGPFVVTEIAGEPWVPSYRGADIWRLHP
jgi:DNA-binding beta-propeller fold protein YncE